jgi:hypothetical protein
MAVPIMTASAAVLTVALTDGVSLAPGSSARPRNIAEAAVMGRAAEVVRFLRAGETPTKIYEVRGGVVGPVRFVTAFEGAVWSGRAEMIRLLERESAALDAAARRHLTCLSLDVEQPHLAEYMTPISPPACESGRSLALLTARTPSWWPR